MQRLMTSTTTTRIPKREPVGSPEREREQLERRLQEIEAKLGVVEMRDDVTCLLLGNLTALQSVAHLVSQKEYVEKQTGQHIALVYEQIASVTLRLLEANQPAVEEEEEA